jgi:hypothetical protein
MMSGSRLQIGKHLESCTSDVQISDPFELDGQIINLIDTPGFDDTTLSEHSILNLIAAFLFKSYVPFILLGFICIIVYVCDTDTTKESA